VANTARGGIAAAREPDLIMADLSVFSHVDLDSGFDLDLDVLVLDRFSQVSSLRKFTSRSIVHVHVEV
jgi:hypothetical protein